MLNIYARNVILKRLYQKQDELERRYGKKHQKQIWSVTVNNECQVP